MASVTIDRAVEPKEIIAALRRFGVTQQDIAAATGVSDRSVRAWNATGGIDAKHYDKLQELRGVVLVLRDSLTDRGVKQWLHARNRLLEGERPIDLLGSDDAVKVRAAAETFVEGGYV